MQITIQGRHLAVTSSLNDYIHAKLLKIKHYFDQLINVHVVLFVEKNLQIAECTISAENHIFHNKIASDDMYKSVDTLLDKIERQILKYSEIRKSRASSHRERGTKYAEELKLADNGEKITLTETDMQVKPMDDLEAILQINADEKEFCIGYYLSETSLHPNFVIHMQKNKYKIYNFNNHWECKEAELINGSKIQINTSENILLPNSFIEDEIEYLNAHSEQPWKIFRSIRSESVTVIYKKGRSNFGVIREPLK